MDRSRDQAGVIAPPPLIYGAALVAGLLLHARVPVKIVPVATARAGGSALTAAAIAVGATAFRALRAAGTSIDPREPTTALVTSGPYRFTRNPLYLSLTFLYAGIALSTRALWPLLLLPAVLATIDRGVVAREEAYLERKFGTDYLVYKERVRRWL
jgi:protein-S-isoprenylcysteine O-methyltransferase Ste14